MEGKKDLAAVGSNFQDHIANDMNFDLKGLSLENMGTLNTDAAFNQSAYEQYIKDLSGPYSAGKANGLVFIALKHFDAGFKKTVRKIRSQVASKFSPERYATNKQLLAGFQKQRDILAKQFSKDDAAVGESLSSLGTSRVLPTTNLCREASSPSTTPTLRPTPSFISTPSRTRTTPTSWLL